MAARRSESEPVIRKTTIMKKKNQKVAAQPDRLSANDLLTFTQLQAAEADLRTSTAHLESIRVARMQLDARDHLVIQHCRNDWSINGGAGWANAAAHEVAYTALLNETMSRMPWLKIYCVWGLYEQNEAATFGGQTQATYRTSISNSVTAAANPNVVLIQGTSFFNWDAAHYGADATHPNDFGQVEAGAKCSDSMGLP